MIFLSFVALFKKNTLKKSVNKYRNRNYFLRPTVREKKLPRNWKLNLGFLAVLGIFFHRNDEYSEVFTEFQQLLKCRKDLLAEWDFSFFVQEKIMSKSSTSLSDFQRELIKISFHFRRLILKRILNSGCFYK